MLRSILPGRPSACLGCLVVALLVGCIQKTDSQRAGRTTEERGRLVVVERFGGVSADRRRLDFDYWNLQLVREDRRVGTVFLGDSITEFWSLAAYFTPSDGVIENRGISSDSASNMLKRFEADVIQLRPRNVVILGGVNDVSLALGQKPEDQIVREVMGSLKGLMDAADKAGITAVFGTTLPMTAGPERHAKFKAVLPRINEALKAMCAARGCVLVDFAAGMSDTNGDLRPELTGDGIHPNDAGYRVMADLLLAAARVHHIRL